MFVERDNNGTIKGVYVCAQSGYAEEFVPDSADEIAAFFKRLDAMSNQKQTLNNGAKALADVMVSKNLASRAEIDAALAALAQRAPA